MVAVLVFSVAGVVALLLVLWLSHRVLVAGGTGAGSADPFGGVGDVFDPGRARAQEDLDSREHQGEMLPSSDEDDLPVRVDLSTGRARVRRPRP